MAYKPPGTYARFVKTASPVAAAGGSRVMALVGTGINYYTIYNEAVTKSNTKPYDELKNNNVFEVLNVSSRPIYNNIITSDNVIYKEHSESNKGYRVNDNIISWDSLSEAECKIDSSFCPRFVYHQGEGVVTNNITASIDENALIPVEDGNWMIEVSYINEEDEDLKPGSKMGCYKVINLLTGEIVGEYAVSPDPVTNEDGSYPIPGILLTVNDTYIKEDGEQKVFVGDYIKMSRAITCPDSTDGTVGSQYVTIAGLDTMMNNGEDGKYVNYHHAVMVPGKGFEGIQHFGRHAMNATNTTEGGYAGSVMDQSVLGAVVTEGSTASGATINQQLYAEFGRHLKTTDELLSTSINATGTNRFGTANGCSNNLAWAMRQAVLMSEVEVYGCTVWSSSGYDTGNAKMQLPLFAHSRNAMNDRSVWYWLKDAASSAHFCICGDYGSASCLVAGGTWNFVRPRFIIAA